MPSARRTGSSGPVAGVGVGSREGGRLQRPNFSPTVGAPRPRSRSLSGGRSICSNDALSYGSVGDCGEGETYGLVDAVQPERWAYSEACGLAAFDGSYPSMGVALSLDLYCCVFILYQVVSEFKSVNWILAKTGAHCTPCFLDPGARRLARVGLLLLSARILI
jgi:hypothetical protein